MSSGVLTLNPGVSKFQQKKASSQRTRACIVYKTNNAYMYSLQDKQRVHVYFTRQTNLTTTFYYISHNIRKYTFVAIGYSIISWAHAASQLSSHPDPEGPYIFLDSRVSKLYVYQISSSCMIIVKISYPTPSYLEPVA